MKDPPPVLESPSSDIFSPEKQLGGNLEGRISRFDNKDFDSHGKILHEVREYYLLADLFVSLGNIYVSTLSYEQTRSATEPIVIDLTVSPPDGNRMRLQRVDIWEGHHGLWAALTSRGMDATLSQGLSWMTKFHYNGTVVLLINGVASNGQKYPRSFNLSGLLLHYPDLEKYAVAAPGLSVSNRHFVQLYPDSPQPQHEWRLSETKFLVPAGIPQLGLYFASFDPVDNGHLGVIEYLLSEKKVDILVVVPNAETANQTFQGSQADRQEMLKLALEDLVQQFPERLFIFLRNSEYVGSMKSRIPFIEGVAQGFGVHPDDVYHIEVINDGMEHFGIHRTLFLPRSLTALPSHMLPCIHRDSIVDRSFIDHWSLSSSLVRRWLQAYRAGNQHLRNDRAEALVDASLPKVVKKYIEKSEIYLAEVSYFHMSPVAPSQTGFVAQTHNPSASEPQFRGFLVTTGVPERVAMFRSQVGVVGVHFTECMGYCGEYIEVQVLDGRLHLLYDSNFLNFDRYRARLARSISPSDLSITIDKVIPQPLTNFEVACYLSHCQVWSEAFSQNVAHVLIVEDRVKFKHDFYKRIRNVLAHLLKENRYDLCYLYREPPDPETGETNLLLTAYLVSRSGLEKLLQGAFPIRKPVDFYVKETIGSHFECNSFMDELVEREAHFLTTIPKYSHPVEFY
jgi:hypothetical protein